MTDYRDPNNIDPNGNYTITQLVKFIREKMFGIDVRESIAKALEKVYEDASKDGNANMEVSEARGFFDTLVRRLNNSDKSLAQKADRSYVDAVLSSIAAGGPRELFYSLAALNAKYPQGAEGTYLVFDVSHTNGAHSYMWNGSVWKDLGPYQGLETPDKSITTRKIAEEAVTAEKTTFITPKTGILDMNDVVHGAFYKTVSGGSTGEMSYSENASLWTITVPVEPEESYCIQTSSYYCYYLDSNFNSVMRFGESDNRQENTTAIAPSNARYLVVNVRYNHAIPAGVVIVKGVSIPSTIVRDDSFDGITNGEKIINGSIGREKVNFIIDKTSLVDSVVDNKFYRSDDNSGLGVMSERDNSGFFYALIPVKTNTPYTISISNFYCYYLDPNLNSVKRFGHYDGVQRDITETSPSNAGYLVVNTKYSSVNDWTDLVVVEGESIPSEIVKYPILNGVGVLAENVYGDIEGGRSEELSLSITRRLPDLSYVTETRNWYEYPLLPTWGHEYLHSWYLKIFENENVRVAMDGDSTTSENASFWRLKQGRRVDIVAKMFKIANYPTSNLIINNNGYGSRSTAEWVGTGDFYSNETDLTNFPNGILHQTMAQNPDLLIFGYGINDATRNGANDDVETRINRFVTNLREGLERIRGDQPVNGRPAYNRDADDLAIILCTPMMTNNTPYRLRENWLRYLREDVRKLAREFNCAYCDLSMRHYDRKSSDKWSSFNIEPYYEQHDSLHPTPYTNADMISLLQDLILPIGLWKYDVSDVDIRYQEEV